MPINICDYDELKAFVLKLRTDSAQVAQNTKNTNTEWAHSFHNGMVHAADQVLVALMSWEKNEPYEEFH